MKSELRVLGIDDAPFSFSDSTTKIIGVVMRGNHYIEGVLCDSIKVDGVDANIICENLILKTRHYPQLKAIFLDGATMGGFNVIDIDALWEKTDVPVITITRDKPDFRRILTALKDHFIDWEQRFKLLNKGAIHKIETSHNPIYVKCAGLSVSEAKEIITISTIRGVIPEPLRVAHIIASGISRGESYGKA